MLSKRSKYAIKALLALAEHQRGEPVRIVRMFDGPLAPVPCASQTAYVPCADCPDEAVCGVHLAMKAVRDATARVLDGTSIASLRQHMAEASALVSRD